jgi:hypothetical protein
MGPFAMGPGFMGPSAETKITQISFHSTRLSVSAPAPARGHRIEANRSGLPWGALCGLLCGLPERGGGRGKGFFLSDDGEGAGPLHSGPVGPAAVGP